MPGSSSAHLNYPPLPGRFISNPQLSLSPLSCLCPSSFFPPDPRRFRNSYATQVGVSYVAQAGGSVADEQVIAACDEYGMSMAFTGIRLFHH